MRGLALLPGRRGARDNRGVIDALGLVTSALFVCLVGGMIRRTWRRCFREVGGTLTSLMSTDGSRKLPAEALARKAVASLKPVLPPTFEGRGEAPHVFFSCCA